MTFEPAAIRKFLEGASPAVVVAERDAAQRRYHAFALDVSADLQTDFRDRAIVSLRDFDDGMLPVTYAENTLLSDEEYAVTDTSVIDPDLLTELARAAGVTPDQDHPPVPNRLRLSALVAVADDHRAFLIRRQNPVRHLARDVLTLSLSRSRLTRADPTFVYDATFDLVIFDDSVAIRSQNAFDAVFRDDAQRAEETRRAVGAMGRFVRPADRAALVAAADADSLYGAKLRRSLLAGVFDAVDMDAVKATVDEFSLALAFEGDALVFPRPRTARWELLYVLEDAFVQGRATGRRYRANSKRDWARRSIDSVRLDRGRVTEVRGPGEWSPRAAADVLADLAGRRRIEYVARLADGPALVELHGQEDERELWVSGDDPQFNRLLELAT